MKRIWIALIGMALLAGSVQAQFATRTQDSKTQDSKAQDKSAQATEPSQPSPANAQDQRSDLEDISGMYTFLHDGEFVQINLEQGNIVTGFVSRFGDSDTDKSNFLDQFFSKGAFDGTHVSWVTKAVHNVWYEFSGTLDHAPNKKPAQEGYRLLKGKLTEHTTDANKKDVAKSRDVELKSFPQEVDEQ